MKEAETKEANLLTGKPYTFDIVYHKQIRRCSWLPFLGSRSELHRDTLEIHSPTLAVLDQLSREWMEIDINENDFKSTDVEGMAKARALVFQHAKRLAKVVAIAVLGERIFKVKYKAGDYIERELNEPEIALLASRIYTSVTPAQLAEVAKAICIQSDLASFLSAIVLMKGASTMRSQTIEQ